ncbi:MAG: hypothetical protein ABEI96_08185 [Haloarculaceae archaeon]
MIGYLLSVVAAGVPVAAAGTNDASALGLDTSLADSTVDGAATPGPDGTAAVAPANAQVVPAPTGFTGRIDLRDANATLSGEAANDTAGRSIVSVGDVDGDGHTDLLIGAPGNDSAGQDAGAAYLVFGPVEEGDVSLADADVKLSGVAANDSAGWSVAAAGDLNGDGYDDVLVGAPFNDAFRPNAGAVYVVYGNASLPATRSLADANVTLYGGLGDHAGWSVSNTSAVAGSDGGVLVGAPFDDGNGHNAGAVYLIGNRTVGNETTSVVTLATEADAKLTGANATDRAGWSVDDAGDHNDDGVGDLVVGAPLHNGTGPRSGAAYLVYGNVSRDRSLATANRTLFGEAPFDRAGWSVAAASDPTDDGIDDVLVGAPFHDDPERNAGAAYLVNGSANATGNESLAHAGAKFTGENRRDRAGWSVAAAGSGDVTCDAIDDVMVGAPRNDAGGTDAGAAYLVAGNASLAGTTSLSDATATFVGEGPGDEAGVAVASAGDANADGDEDVFVGAPGNDSAGQDAGAAYVLFADCPVPEPDPVDVNTQCADDGGVLRLSNGNDVSVRVEIEGPGLDREFVLDPGEAQRFRKLDNGTYTIRTFTTGDGEPREVDSQTVTFDCAPPLEPVAGLVVTKACQDGAGLLTVRNPASNDVPVEYVVTGPDGFRKSAVLDPGETARFAGLDNGDYRVQGFTTGDQRREVSDATVEVDCRPEPVAVQTTCAGDAGVLQITNDNAVPVTVDVEGPGVDRRFTLDPGQSERLRDLDDGEYTVRTLAKSDGRTVVVHTRSVRIDCQPAPIEDLQLETDCRDDGGLLKIRNPASNEVPLRYVVAGPDDYKRTAVLDPGETAQLSGLANGDYRVRALTVGGDRVKISSRKVTIDCEQPQPEPDPVGVETKCTDNGGVLQVTNGNDVAVQVDVEGPGVERRFTLDPGESERLQELDNGDYTVRTLTAEDENVRVVDTQTATIDCEQPQPEPDSLLFETDCRDDGGLLKIRNPATNDQALKYDVSGPDGYENSSVLEPGETAQLSGLANGEYRLLGLTVGGESQQTVTDETLTIDCEQPQPEPDPVGVETKCADDGGVLQVTNDNDVAVQVDVEGPGIERRFTLDPGESERLQELDNGDYTVRTLTAEDENVRVVDTQTATIDCEQPQPEPDSLLFQTDCRDDGGLLKIRNPASNEQALKYDVSGPNGYENSSVLEPGETVQLSGLANGTYRLLGLTVEGEPQQTVTDETLTIDCEQLQPQPEPDPVGVETKCTDSGGVLQVTNGNDVAVQVDIEGPGVERRFTLDPGQSERLQELDNGTYTVRTLTADDENVRVVDTQTVEIDCERLEPAVANLRVESTQCGRLTFTNEGDETVYINGASLPAPTGKLEELAQLQWEDDPIEPGETQTVAVYMPTNESFEFTATSGDQPGDERATVNGQDRATVEVTRCAPQTQVDAENVTLSALCTDTEDGNATFRIENDNEWAARLQYSVDGSERKTIVAASRYDRGQLFTLPNYENASDRLVVPTGDDGEAQVRLYLDGQLIANVSSTETPCSFEAVAAETSCADGGGVLDVTNPNLVPVQVDVDGPGIERRITLDAGESERFPELDNGEYTVTTITADDENVRVVDTENVTVDCEQPAPTPDALLFETDCRDDGGLLKIRNPASNEQALRYDVSGPDGYENSSVLEPGETAQLAGLANGTYRLLGLTVEGEPQQTVTDESIEVDCEGEDESNP